MYWFSDSWKTSANIRDMTQLFGAGRTPGTLRRPTRHERQNPGVRFRMSSHHLCGGACIDDVIVGGGSGNTACGIAEKKLIGGPWRGIAECDLTACQSRHAFGTPTMSLEDLEVPSMMSLNRADPTALQTPLRGRIALLRWNIAVIAQRVSRSISGPIW